MSRPLPLVRPGLVAVVAVVAVLGLAVGARADSARPSEDAAAIRATIEARWLEMAPPGASLEILRVPTLRHGSGDVSFRVVLPDTPSRPGPRAVAVTCAVDGRPVARGLANVMIRTRETVWEASRPLRRGETLKEADLVRRSLIFERPPGALLAPDKGRRFRVARDVPAGARLRARDVRAVPDVEAGSEILLVAKRGTATVAVPGRVRRSANVGEKVLVLNPVTGSVVEAVLTDRATAVLVPPGSSETANGRKKS